MFNITAQVYRNNDKTKQNLLINEVVTGISDQKALENFKIHFPSLEFSLVKVLSVEKISQGET